MFSYNKSLVYNAKSLRKNMTPEEKHLWYDFLKKLPVTVHRQHNIGDYIVDFYIASKKIVIEVDGSQHTENLGMLKDTHRDRELAKLGIKVLRYYNNEIKCNFSGVAQDILNNLELTFFDLK